jgi:hypothetical protein
MANVLWGPASTEYPNIQRYKLLADGRSPKRETVFFVNAMFKEGQLQTVWIEPADGVFAGSCVLSF